MSDHAVTNTSYTVHEWEDYKTGHIARVEIEGDTTRFKLRLHEPGGIIEFVDRESVERAIVVLEAALSFVRRTEGGKPS